MDTWMEEGGTGKQQERKNSRLRYEMGNGEEERHFFKTQRTGGAYSVGANLSPETNLPDPTE
jgi:hypothetical protein